MNAARGQWDVVCRVVDNYGDVGIAWRLARQLAVDPARHVRLIVDRLPPLVSIEPSVDAGQAHQIIDGIEIAVSAAIEQPQPAVGDVVVELLGCGLPDAYLDAMEARATRPVWIDFEHLSAESWVAEFHGLPSPHPSRSLVKHFFYPGFDARSGGLLLGAMPSLSSVAESSLAPFLERLRIRTEAGERRISLFAYPDAPVGGLLDVLAADPIRRWSVIVPDGVLTDALAAWFGECRRVRARGAVSVTLIPFVQQDDYDRLLQACDVNFVRGEDSFVRAQLVGKPFVWQTYRQADGAHLAKLAAFEEICTGNLAPSTRRAQRAFWEAWNDPDGDVASVTTDWLDALPELGAAADMWRASLTTQVPLVDRLAAFVAARQGSP